MVECGKTCFVIYMSLILMTAGFVLTLTGWFAPPLNNFVLTVRMGGPITLLVGFVLLICSCFMCAIEQGKCCLCLCQRSDEALIIGSDPETETQFDRSDQAVIVVNKVADPCSFPRGYQPVPTSDKHCNENVEKLPRNGIVIQNTAVTDPENMEVPDKHQIYDNKHKVRVRALPNVCPLPSQTNEGYLKQSTSAEMLQNNSKTLLPTWRLTCDQSGNSVCGHPHQSPCPLTPKTRKQRTQGVKQDGGQDIDKVTRWNPDSPLHMRRGDEKYIDTYSC